MSTIDALKALVSTIQSTGGLIAYQDGTYGCVGDPDWIDLADAAMAAQAALENEHGIVVELDVQSQEKGA